MILASKTRLPTARTRRIAHDDSEKQQANVHIDGHRVTGRVLQNQW